MVRLKKILVVLTVIVLVSVAIRYSAKLDFREQTFEPTQNTVLVAGSFRAGDYSSEFELPQGTTVYDAMTKLASTTDFQFAAKHFSGLGYFIEEIGGVKSEGGFYWTLYINGQRSMVGASDYTINDGDVIEWKFENNNDQ